MIFIDFKLIYMCLNCGKDSSPCVAVHWTERSEGSG